MGAVEISFVPQMGYAIGYFGEPKASHGVPDNLYVGRVLKPYRQLTGSTGEGAQKPYGP